MAAIGATVTVPRSSVSSTLQFPRTLSTIRASFLSPWPSSLGFRSLKLNSSSSNPPGKRLGFVVKAARSESKGVSLGFRAPDFELPEPLTGKTWALQVFEPYPALLVMFICNHCPFVKHLKKNLVKLSNFYMKKGLGVVAISSNSVVTHPQDGPEFMAEEARVYGYPFPYLYDELASGAPSGWQTRSGIASCRCCCCEQQQASSVLGMTYSNKGSTLTRMVCICSLKMLLMLLGQFALRSFSCLKRMVGGRLSLSIMDNMMTPDQVITCLSLEGI